MLYLRETFNIFYHFKSRISDIFELTYKLIGKWS